VLLALLMARWVAVFQQGVIGNGTVEVFQAQFAF
jgi:hypothetical protein